MSQDIYHALSRHLDDLPGGFPATDSGVELRILRRLFTPEEAALAVKLTMIPEEAHVIAHRVKMPSQEAEKLLDEMALKGLIFSLESKVRPRKYMASQFIIGIWEYHVNDLNPDFIRDVNEYLPSLIDFETWRKAPQLRTVPVERSLDVKLQALPYENAYKLVEKQKVFLEAPCICRKEHRILGEGCDKPEGLCLVFGIAAEYYHRNGLGRFLDKQEALDLLKKADEAGLVLQPSFAKEIVNICCCCGCCCQVLKTYKRHPRPAELVSSPFIAALNSETCSGCGVCVDRCQMDALALSGEKVVLTESQCIGCGLCVTTCPTQSLSLKRKSQEKHSEIPNNMIKSYIHRAKVRGKLKTGKLVSMALRAKFNKLRASK